MLSDLKFEACVILSIVINCFHSVVTLDLGDIGITSVNSIFFSDFFLQFSLNKM